MQYNDNEYKFVAVLNKQFSTGRLLNILGHLTAGFCSHSNAGQFNMQEYKDAEGNLHALISKFPFIVLKADNSNQIRRCRNEAAAANIPIMDFTESMLATSSETQVLQTAALNEADMNYIGIIMFGKAEEMVFTKRFSLF